MTSRQVHRQLWRQFRCLFGHDWHQHPEFEVLPVRECKRCLRAESRAFLAGRWIRRAHVERTTR